MIGTTDFVNVEGLHSTKSVIEDGIPELAGPKGRTAAARLILGQPTFPDSTQLTD